MSLSDEGFIDALIWNGPFCAAVYLSVCCPQAFLTFHPIQNKLIPASSSTFKGDGASPSL
jgi:hypothetical protein